MTQSNTPAAPIKFSLPGIPDAAPVYPVFEIDDDGDLAIKLRKGDESVTLGWLTTQGVFRRRLIDNSVADYFGLKLDRHSRLALWGAN